MRFRISL